MSLKIPLNIENMSPYKPENFFHENEGQVLKMDWNEYLGEKNDLIVKEIYNYLHTEKGRPNYYADLECRLLKNKISEYLNFNADGINVYNGSDSALENIYKTFIELDDQIIIVGPTYDNSRSLTQFYTMREAKVLLFEDPFIINYEIVKNLNDVKCIYICNPNNPTGTIFTREQINDIAESLPSTLIIIDEAYVEFTGNSLFELCNIHDNIIIVRTFSKAFGIAGLRLGYTISSLKLSKYLKATRNGKEVNALAQVAGKTCLDNIDLMYDYINEIKISKSFTLKSFTDLGLKCIPTPANFVLLKIDEPKDFVYRLRSKGILVRDISTLPQLEGYIRITLGSLKFMEQFFSRLNELRI